MDSSVKDKYQNKYPQQKDQANSTESVAYNLIKTEKELLKTVKVLNRENLIAVDLEADSMFHFNEKICLIQIATKKSVYIIDPLSINDMSCLSKIFSDGHIRKILHGSDYDIRCLYRDFQFTINNLFDSELAARFLGYPGTGLNAVLQKKFSISLEKKYQKKDWSKRPLPEPMLRYAGDDVRYLISLYMLQMDELAEKGRQSWVFEESDCLSKVKPQNSNGLPLFTRIKGAGRMDSKSLAVLEVLLNYRLEIAKQKDKPPFKIIGNHVLLEIANEKPGSMKKLKELGALSESQLNMHGKAIIDLIKTTHGISKHDLPCYPRKPSPINDVKFSHTIKKLKKWRQQKADILKMDAGMVLNNSVLKILAEKNPHTIDNLNAIAEMKNWQKKEFGKELIHILK